MMTLYGYWRSSSSYRVRIALALKGIEVNHVAVNLREGLQGSKAHKSRNPQGYVPVLELAGGTQLTQSIAIIDYLDAVYPGTPLIPHDPVQRAKVLAASLVIATDIQPIQNLAVLKYIRAQHGQGDAGVKAWAHDWIAKGLTALEEVTDLTELSVLNTNAPGLFECCLVPQIYNARRFGVDMSAFPTLSAIDAACKVMPAFIQSAPENQTDAVI